MTLKYLSSAKLHRTCKMFYCNSCHLEMNMYTQKSIPPNSSVSLHSYPSSAGFKYESVYKSTLQFRAEKLHSLYRGKEILGIMHPKFWVNTKLKSDSSSGLGCACFDTLQLQFFITMSLVFAMVPPYCSVKN